MPDKTAPLLPAAQAEQFMAAALAAARGAAACGEVPVGAVVVHGGAVIATTGNRMETAQDATQHAEMLVLREAAARLGSWRLSDCIVVVTLEPCPMCAGAMVQARLQGCVYGAKDPKKGADVSVYDVLRNPRNNHLPLVQPGVLAAECGALLSDFFAGLRRDKKAAG